ncbi:hypothetical protein [Rhizobium sp. P44RR-XXIV]|uniref:hypothetical protein n=1 Tax=Rhizobium sp. P44RR-XXIV TaxID=1921145 RepID=UPI000985E28E|nr:hypothetical protein [Rhizobium sp. P44RR-XXIV]TIX89161.1 hypothetical protein BSK43_021365 [Rhizobium sp. P44RR-XXIV]
MHKFLKVIGGVLFFGPLLVIALVASQQSPGAVTGYMLMISLPVLVSGALLIGFANIIEHLIAIRASSEQQARALQSMLDQRAA